MSKVTGSLFGMSILLFSCGDKSADVTNNLPSAPEISLSPNPATTMDDLQVSIIIDSVDPDGDEIDYTYVWTQNSVVFENDTAILSSDETAKGDEWGVTVYASDGEGQGDSTSASITIDNSAPVISVSIAPETPTTEDELSIVVENDDPDGDDLSFTYTWIKDGTDIGFSDTTVASSATVKEEVWTVQVVANDGDADSEPAEASVRILNAQPVVSEESLLYLRVTSFPKIKQCH